MIKTFYIIFTDSERWFSTFLRPKFSHVAIYWEYADNIYLGVDAGKSLNLVAKNKIVKESNNYILKVTIDSEQLKKTIFPFRFGFISCVIITKFVLGLKSFSLTPYQLFKFLTKYRSRDKSKNKHIIKVGVI